MRKFIARGSVVVALLAAQHVASAERIYGISKSGPRLFYFDSASPGAVTLVGQINGVDPGHLLYAIDFRPATGQLFGISESFPSGNDVQIYTINLTTATATPLGGGFTIGGEPNFYYGIDFDPVTDQLRVVSDRGRNLRINPQNGSVAAIDTDVAYAPGDVNAGTSPLVSAIAYNNNVSGATSTTLYAFDDLRFPDRNFSRIGSTGGAPVSPNSGQMFTLGGTGLIADESTVGMDISAATGTAYLQLDPFGGPGDSLYTVNLANGSPTQIGQIGFVTGGIRDISVLIPEPATIALINCAAFFLLCRRKR